MAAEREHSAGLRPSSAMAAFPQVLNRETKHKLKSFLLIKTTRYKLIDIWSKAIGRLFQVFLNHHN